MKKSKLAIFDLDGTLFDTKDVNFYAYQQALSDFDYSLDYDTYTQKCNGKYYKEYLPLFIKNITNDLMEEIHNKKKLYYVNHLLAAKINYHLFRIIDLIKEEYHIAIVTTASRKNCEDIINYFKKREIFDLILTHNDVVNTKPDPEGFIKAMEYFKIDADNTIIFEDSELGIEAARRSGAFVYSVINFSE